MKRQTVLVIIAAVCVSIVGFTFLAPVYRNWRAKAADKALLARAFGLQVDQSFNAVYDIFSTGRANSYSQNQIDVIHRLARGTPMNANAAELLVMAANSKEAAQEIEPEAIFLAKKDPKSPLLTDLPEKWSAFGADEPAKNLSIALGQSMP